ncbi:MAG: DEAD/DEAH box helicase [Candidatus Aminicenantes bacterium]|nr:DEAD/DEAH box helicase [Candidatus Aminicenantes bacterium]
MGIVLDKFQKDAIRLIGEGKSVIVSAPTGAGKTLIAEHVMQRVLYSGKRVIYTSPVKALSNQKFRDFSVQFPDKTGIVTGDVSINPYAPLLIMTTEILRNRLFSENSSSVDYSWVIFDEIHYIDDPDRGTVWEESLMFLPEGMKFLGLSATLPNVDEFASWISRIRGEDISVVKEDKRPVPLNFYFVSGRKVYKDPAFIKNRSHGYSIGEQRYGKRKKLPHDNDVISLITGLRSRDRLPAIYFTMNRKRTVSLAESLASFDFLGKIDKKKVTDTIDIALQRHGSVDNPGFNDIIPLLKRGIAYHHAGMLPTVKELVEKLFTAGLIRIVFATATFSLGINMPAKSVILDELKKRSGRTFRIMPRRDFFQMGGRAGRRGIDKTGYVYSFTDPSIQLHSIKSLINGIPEPVSSRFAISYAGILNLYERYGEDIYSIYYRSFKYFLEKRKEDGVKLSGLRKKVKLLKELKHLDAGGVTKSGKFAREIHGYELPLGEVFKSNLIKNLYPKDLVYITLALVYEPKRGEKAIPEHGRSKYLYKLTKPLISRIHRYEKANDINITSPAFNFNLSPAAELWMKEEPFFWCVYNAGIDEGDLIRYFRMSIQILRELLNTDISMQSRSKVEKATSLLNRDIIDAERELRGENVRDQQFEEKF